MLNDFPRKTIEDFKSSLGSTSRFIGEERVSARTRNRKAKGFFNSILGNYEKYDYNEFNRTVETKLPAFGSGDSSQTNEVANPSGVRMGVDVFSANEGYSVAQSRRDPGMVAGDLAQKIPEDPWVERPFIYAGENYEAIASGDFSNLEKTIPSFIMDPKFGLPNPVYNSEEGKKSRDEIRSAREKSTPLSRERITKERGLEHGGDTAALLLSLNPVGIGRAISASTLRSTATQAVTKRLLPASIKAGIKTGTESAKQVAGNMALSTTVRAQNAGSRILEKLISTGSKAKSNLTNINPLSQNILAKTTQKISSGLTAKNATGVVKGYGQSLLDIASGGTFSAGKMAVQRMKGQAISKWDALSAGGGFALDTFTLKMMTDQLAQEEGWNDDYGVFDYFKEDPTAVMKMAFTDFGMDAINYTNPINLIKDLSALVEASPEIAEMVTRDDSKGYGSVMEMYMENRPEAKEGVQKRSEGDDINQRPGNKALLWALKTNPPEELKEKYQDLKLDNETMEEFVVRQVGDDAQMWLMGSNYKDVRKSRVPELSEIEMFRLANQEQKAPIDEAQNNLKALLDINSDGALSQEERGGFKKLMETEKGKKVYNELESLIIEGRTTEALNKNIFNRVLADNIKRVLVAKSQSNTYSEEIEKGKIPEISTQAEYLSDEVYRKEIDSMNLSEKSEEFALPSTIKAQTTEGYSAFMESIDDLTSSSSQVFADQRRVVKKDERLNSQKQISIPSALTIVNDSLLEGSGEEQNLKTSLDSVKSGIGAGMEVYKGLPNMSFEDFTKAFELTFDTDIQDAAWAEAIPDKFKSKGFVPNFISRAGKWMSGSLLSPVAKMGEVMASRKAGYSIPVKTSDVRAFEQPSGEKYIINSQEKTYPVVKKSTGEISRDFAVEPGPGSANNSFWSEMNRKGLQPAAEGVIPPTSPSQSVPSVSLPAIDTSTLMDAAKMNKEAFATALESAKINKEAAESMQNITAETMNKFQVDIGGLDISGIADQLKASLGDQIKKLIEETLSKSLDYLNPFTNKPPGT